MILTHTQAAQFETTRRLFACLINESLVRASIVDTPKFGVSTWLELQSLKEAPGLPAEVKIQIATSSDARLSCTGGSLESFLQPDDLAPPVIIEHQNGDSNAASSRESVEFHPAILFDVMATWFVDQHLDSEVREQITNELRNSAQNQEEWLRIASQESSPELVDSSIKWERAIIRGHPTHPMHRSCVASPPLRPIVPTELMSILNPSIAFLSVLSSDVLLIGPFTTTLETLLHQLDISQPVPGRLIIPCLARQIPAILQIFPEVHVLPTKSLEAFAQASLRTVLLPPKAQFPYILKFAFSCRVTSSHRTVTPWTACIGPEISELMINLLPAEMWICKEIAAVTGSQQDFDEAKHITCLLREDLEPRAREKGQALIVAAALAESGANDHVANAEKVFGLDTGDKRKMWFRSYTSILLRLTLQPLLRYGIAIEVHGQNMLVRIDIRTHAIAGFAFRDLGGVKIHMPTLRQQGYNLRTALPGDVIQTDDVAEAWATTHHALFQVHLNQLMHALRLHHDGGWAVVREELKKCMNGEEDQDTAKQLEDFFLGETMPLKCFLRMRMEGIHRDYIYRDVPNILLG